MSIAHAILVIAAIYAAGGILIGGWFVVAGVAKLDPAARNAPIGFRLLILPGAMALWPVLLFKLVAVARRQS